MRLHIIRHGDPDYEHDSLTPLGQEEATALAEKLRHLPILEIYSSPLGRAFETAEYTAKALELEIKVLPWVRESGKLRVESDSSVLPSPIVIWNLPADQLLALERKGTQWIENETLPHPHIDEYFEEMNQGMKDFLAAYGMRTEVDGFGATKALPKHDVAIFCHHGAGIALLSLLLGIPAPALWRTHWLAPTSVTTLLLEEQDRKRVNFRLLQLGSTAHLHNKDSLKNTSGLIYNTI